MDLVGRNCFCMLSALRSDQLVEVFSFKLHAAWSDRLVNYILGCSKP